MAVVVHGFPSLQAVLSLRQGRRFL